MMLFLIIRLIRFKKTIEAELSKSLKEIKEVSFADDNIFCPFIKSENNFISFSCFFLLYGKSYNVLFYIE